MMKNFLEVIKSLYRKLLESFFTLKISREINYMKISW